VRNPLAEHLQHWASTLQISGFAAHHDGQATGLRARDAAGDRRIQPRHAAPGCQFRSHFPGGGSFQARAIDQQLAAAPALCDALRAEHHLTHDGGIGQAQHYHVAAAAQLGRIAGQARTGREQRRAFVRAAVPYRQGIASGQQALTHRQAHQANSGKPQRRQCFTHEQLQAANRRTRTSGCAGANPA